MARVGAPEFKWERPGPGTWTRDATHMPRPASFFLQELFGPALIRGFSESTRRYGMLVSHLLYGYVHGFAYIQVVPARPEEAPARVAAAENAIERKLWREDLRRWDEEVKPAAVRAHLAFQRVDLAALSDAQLLDHLDACREHVRRMITQHHQFNACTMVPTGDFLAHAQRWTGLPLSWLVRLLAGAAPVSAGALGELDRLVASLHTDDGARTALDSERDPAELLEVLRGWPGQVGASATAYLDRVAYRILDGFDIVEPLAIECPEVIVSAIRGALDQSRGGEIEQHAAQTAHMVRNLVPQPERERFDELLAEARLTYRVRDERGVYSDVWAYGLMRRAVLEAGSRLVCRGLIDAPHHLAHASWGEMRSLLADGTGASGEELALRAEIRASARPADAPPLLGPPPHTPPPPDGLTSAATRVMAAMDAFLPALFEDSERESDARTVRGLAASPGTIEGTARVLRDPAEIDRIRDRDVLVTTSTSEAFNLVLSKLGGLVTDSGGLLSHGAILAREFGIPCVVGTRMATGTIADGARVRVDGEEGEVTIL